MITLDTFFSNWRGWYVAVVLLLSLLMFLRMAISKEFKSTVVFYSLPIIFGSMVVWFLGGAFYADMWKYGKWGTFDALPAQLLPEFFDASAWGFAVAGLFTFTLLFWVIKAQKVRGGNKNINFNL